MCLSAFLCFIVSRRKDEKRGAHELLAGYNQRPESVLRVAQSQQVIFHEFIIHNSFSGLISSLAEGHFLHLMRICL